MLAYAHGTSETPLLGETIGENLSRAAAEHGDREALVVRHQDVRWTYAELDERVTQMARALVAVGLAPGDCHEAIADVQVVGVPDARYGEAVAAFVIVREGATLDEAACASTARDESRTTRSPPTCASSRSSR